MPSGEKNKKLFVANLSSRVKERDLEDVFESYGKIAEIKILERRDIYAFVEFEDYRDAEDACERTNGMELFGRRLRVEFANNEKPRHERTERFNNRERGSQECYNCGEVGHIAKRCPKGSQSRRTTNPVRDRNDGKCFKCGSTRHKIRDCPERSRSRSKDRRGHRSSRRHRDSSRRRRYSSSGSRSDSSASSKSNSRDRRNSRKHRKRSSSGSQSSSRGRSKSQSVSKKNGSKSKSQSGSRSQSNNKKSSRSQSSKKSVNDKKSVSRSQSKNQ